MAKRPRRLSLVKFDVAGIPRGFRRKYPFRRNATYVFLGEIPNMPGHCVVADFRSGKFYSGYHTNNFVEISRDDT
jgi:hypothetical protein